MCIISVELLAPNRIAEEWLFLNTFPKHIPHVSLSKHPTDSTHHKLHPLFSHHKPHLQTPLITNSIRYLFPHRPKSPLTPPITDYTIIVLPFSCSLLFPYRLHLFSLFTRGSTWYSLPHRLHPSQTPRLHLLFFPAQTHNMLDSTRYFPSLLHRLHTLFSI